MVLHTISGRAIVDGTSMHFDAEMASVLEGNGLQLEEDPTAAAGSGSRRVLLGNMTDWAAEDDEDIIAEQKTSRRQLGRRRRRSRRRRSRAPRRIRMPAITISSPSPPPPPPPSRVNCRGTWSAWSGCSKECGTGRRSRVYTIHTPGAFGGRGCDKRTGEVQQQNCNAQRCP